MLAFLRIRGHTKPRPAPKELAEASLIQYVRKLSLTFNRPDAGCGGLAHPIQELVPSSCQSHEPGFPAIQPERRPGKCNPHKGIFHRISRHHRPDLLSLIRCPRNGV